MTRLFDRKFAGLPGCLYRCLPSRKLGRGFLFAALAVGFGISILLSAQTSHAVQPAANSSLPNSYCQLSPAEITQMSTLHQAALKGDAAAQQQYQALVQQHAQQLNQCRRQTWPQSQAIWLRLYPCDALNGVVEELLDRIVSRGYNEVYLEVFYNGQVLLPSAQNPTVWPAVIRTAGHDTTDLLAQTIALGHQRGLKVYAWMFTLNFGYTYSQRAGTEQVLARNGSGDSSLTAHPPEAEGPQANADETFVDPYSLQAKQDYVTLLQAILQRRPDGVLFDYIRYPKGTGSASVASRVQDLWIYGASAQQALLNRALNQKGASLIQQYLSRGYVSTGDLDNLNDLYPQEPTPLWQGLNPKDSASVSSWQDELWRLSIAHAIQGILDFLNLAIAPVEQLGLKAGAVFFPDGNQTVGAQGFDSRLQPWDRFPSKIEWHPMSYATCPDSSCIVAQIQRVIGQAPAGTDIQPALAGAWGQALNNHPPLEQQMQAIQRAFPQIQSVSHFAFAWQEPEFDRNRKFCKLQ